MLETTEEYWCALRMISLLMAQDPEPDSSLGIFLYQLATLVQDYELIHYPMGDTND